MATTINTSDVRDAIVTSEKLADDITIRGILGLSQTSASALYNTLSIPSANNYLQIVNGTTFKGLAIGKLLVSDLASDWSSVPSSGAYIKGNLVVNGDLTVNGTNTVLHTTTVNVEDNILLLNSGLSDTTTPPTTLDAGIEIERGSYANSSIYWDENSNYWMLTNPGDNATVPTAYRIIDENYGDSRYVNTSGDTMTGKLTITNNGGTLALKAGATVDHVYMEYYADSQAQTTRSGWIGYGSAGDPSMSISNDMTNGNIALTSNGTGVVYVTPGLTVNGNIVVSGTVDGVDVGNHNSNSITDVKHVTDAVLAALAGTSGTAPSSTNKFVDNSDTRLTNSRTPTTHGDSLHNALSYFDTVTDGTTSKTASTAKQNIKFAGAGGASVAVSSDTTYDAIVTVTAQNKGLSSVSGSGNGTETFTLTDGTTVTFNAGHTHNYLPLTGGTITSDLTVQGTLTVTGTTTYLDTETLNVYDNMITLNSNVTAAPTENAGIEVERGTSTNVSILWDETNDCWTLTSDGTNYPRIIDQTFGDARYVNVSGDTMNGSLKSTVVYPFISKSTGYKSWVQHHPASNYLVMAPSTTVDAEDWDWAHQIVFTDAGSISTSGGVSVGGDVAIAGNSLSFGNGSYISNETDASLDIRADGTLRLFGDGSTNNYAIVNSTFFGIGVSTESYIRTVINTADGKIGFGPGTATRDTWLYRDATNSLKTDGKFTASGPIVIDHSAVGGDSSWDDAGLIIKNTNATAGEAVVSFLNASTGSYYWMTGLNQSAHYDIGYGNSFANGTTLMRIQNDGKIAIGLGHTLPRQLVHMKLDQDAATTLFIENATASAAASSAASLKSDTSQVDLITYSSVATGTLGGFNKTKAAYLRTTSGYGCDRLVVATGTAAPINFSTNDTHAMTITSDQKVGVGVTDPGETFEVAGVAKTQSIKVADSSRSNKFEIKYNSTTKSLSFNFVG